MNRSDAWRIAIALLPVLLPGSHAGAQPSLEVGPSSVPLLVPRPNGSQDVQIDLSVFENLLTGEAHRFAICLPDDRQVSGVVLQREQRPPDGTLLSGIIEDKPGTTFRLTRTQDGVVGFLRSPTIGSFEIRTDTSDRVIFRELDMGKLSTCGFDHYNMRDQALNSDQLGRAARAVIRPGCDDGTMIDLLVVYTTAAKNAAGGQAMIEALIDFAVMDANDAFANSNVSTALNLVATEEVSYEETGIWTVDGPRLIDPIDGFLDAIHPLRDLHGADCVSLWVNTLDTGGIGYFPDASFKGVGTSGLSMLRLDNATLLTLAHEIGHNFFCAHDQPNAPDPPFADYSFGFVEPGAAWRTIMATTSTPLVIPHFSNPNVNWQGINPGPTGVAEGQPTPSDNARTINEMRTVVANFRTTHVPGLGPRILVDAAAPPGGDGQSWSTALNDLQEALCLAKGSANAVQEVWLKAGTYKPSDDIDREASFEMVDGVKILGGFDGSESLRSQRDPQTNITILSGDIGTPGNDADNSYHVVDASLNDATAILDGITISSGHADGAGHNHGGGGIIVNGGGTPQFIDCIIKDNVASSFGAGMFNTNGSSPTLIGCTFENNAVLGATWPAGGGGLYNYSLCNPILIDCQFRMNSARLGSGIANFFSSSPELNGCTFVQNVGGASSEGGAIYGYSFCSPTIIDCVFDSNGANLGGALAGFFDCSATIDRCIFRRNSAAGDGGALYNYANSNVELTNCLLTGNTATSGGAIINLFSNTGAVNNCTLVGNEGTFGAGGIFNYQSDSIIRNSILWANSIGAMTDESAQVGNNASAPVIMQSTIEGWTGTLGGIGNNATDPDLRDADGIDDLFGTDDDNARPRPGSSAIDTGDNAGLPSGMVLDLDRRPRIVDARVDRGAYEFDPIPGDFDGDIDIDLVDHAAFVDCMSGPGESPSPTPSASPETCRATFDFDADLDIDLYDFIQFTIAFQQ